MRTYQLCILKDGHVVPTSWAPRSYAGAKALWNYYTRTWPNNSYWLSIID